MTTPNRFAIAFCAMCALGSTRAIAGDCSGGPAGGMDATGNDCSSPPDSLLVPTPTPAAPQIAKPSSAKTFSKPLDRIANKRTRNANAREQTAMRDRDAAH